MKGILIDPDKREIIEVEFDGELKSFYELLGCDLIDRVAIDDNNDLVVDDEFLYKGHTSFFTIEGVEGQFQGKALIVGVNQHEGEWVDPINLKALKISFYYPMNEGADEAGSEDNK